MSGFSRRVETPVPKKKATKKRAERSSKVEKKPKGKKAVKKAQMDLGTRVAKEREPKASRETAPGLDTRDDREG